MFTTKEMKMLVDAMENYSQRRGNDTLDLLYKVREGYLDTIVASQAASIEASMETLKEIWERVE